MRRRIPAAAEKKLADDSRLRRAWRHWRRERLDALLAGPFGAPAQELLAFFKTMTGPTALVDFVRSGPWSGADEDTRFEILALIDAVIVKQREKRNLPSFDDALPGQPLNAFLILRAQLAPQSPSDDGAARGEARFDEILKSSTLDRGGKYLKWNDAIGWADNDGNKPPSPLMAWKLREFSGQWKDRQLLREPISKLEELNTAIPEDDWPFNEQSGKKEKPWKRFVRIDFVDPATGRRYRYEHHTTGAQIMFEDLRDDVVNMRLLRGDNCLPVVHLTECPWPLF
jgi:hypothetical protein